MEPALQGPLAHFEDLRGLAGAQTLDVAKDDRSAVGERKTAQRLLDRVEELAGLKHRIRTVAPVRDPLPDLIVELERLGCRPADAVLGLIDADSGQPRGEPGASFEATDVDPRSN